MLYDNFEDTYDKQPELSKATVSRIKSRLMSVYYLTLCKYCTMQVGEALPQIQYNKPPGLSSNQVPAKD